MLRRLSVENYALIDKLELELDPHLNIITGETGAGKSILLGALGLLLGVKNDGSLVFYTCDEAGNSEGLTLAQLAERMQARGCRTALNLDGGGSTAAGVTYPGYASGATANVPSDGKLRECANFIFLVRQKQDAGTASKLYLYPFGGYALPGAKISLTVKAADNNSPALPSRQT